MNDVEILLKIVTNGMRVLSTRIVMILTLLMTFALFGYAMWQPDYLRLACATAFALFVFLPVKRSDKGEASNG